MSLDAYQGDDAIRQLHADRTRKLNGITLGPDSPLRSKQAGGRPTKPDSQTSRQIEHALQVALFEKIDDPANQLERPELAMVYAIPNFFGASAATKAQGGRAKAEGRRPGVPDIHCPVARGGYIGLYIEMKRPKGTTSPEQAHWMSALARAGHKVVLQCSTEGAWAALLNYLDSSSVEAREIELGLQAKAEAYDRINTPEVDDFLSAVKNEALHQRERWGIDQDGEKSAADWFWLVGYLAGKALHDVKGKRLHHVITAGAALLNWHAHASGSYATKRPKAATAQNP